MSCERDEIDAYVGSMDLTGSVSAEEFAKAVYGAVKDRGLIFYFVWRTIKELHPEIDADAVMAEASRRYGEHKSSTMGDVRDAKDALLNQTSRTGLLAFDQEITRLAPDIAEKVIRRCPHIDAFDEVGATREEKIKLCTELLMPGDHALLSPYPDIKLEFPKNLAADDVCVMVTKLND